MAKSTKAPVIVAELGRPETPGETAARKARDSAQYRQRKTVNNLAFSLLVTLGVVLLIFLLTPQGTDVFSQRTVDVTTLAQEAAPSAGRTLAAPAVPSDWKAKSAQLAQSDGVNTWHINYTALSSTDSTPSYAAVTQAFTSDSSTVSDIWVANRLEQQVPTGNTEIAGTTWVVYDHPERDAEQANVLYALQGTWNGDTILVYGTATAATLESLAELTIQSLNTPSK